MLTGKPIPSPIKIARLYFSPMVMPGSNTRSNQWDVTGLREVLIDGDYFVLVEPGHARVYLPMASTPFIPAQAPLDPVRV